MQVQIKVVEQITKSSVIPSNKYKSHSSSYLIWINITSREETQSIMMMLSQEIRKLSRTYSSKLELIIEISAKLQYSLT